jgi:chemotaxis receptor (MCP) glutamine deamidase CheD
VAEEPAEIRTVLGSCVAACIFDPQAAVGGMNHFALVHAGDSRGSTRYGDNAMRALVDKIVALGGRRERLQCKAFGASQVLRVGEPNRAVPESNAQFVRAWLSDNGIPLVAEKMGGTLPLAVRFETHNGRVLVKALDVGQTPWDR